MSNLINKIKRIVTLFGQTQFGRGLTILFWLSYVISVSWFIAMPISSALNLEPIPFSVVPALISCIGTVWLIYYVITKFTEAVKHVIGSLKYEETRKSK